MVAKVIKLMSLRLMCFYIMQFYVVVRVGDNGVWQANVDSPLEPSVCQSINKLLNAENGDLLYLSAGDYMSTVCFIICSLVYLELELLSFVKMLRNDLLLLIVNME
jgi:hypothetical protein